MSISHNNWLLLNQIIYDIYNSTDSCSMRSKFLENIKMIIPYDKANFFLPDANKSEHFIKDPVSIGFEKNAYDDYYSSYDKFDHNNWIFATAQNDAFIMSELLSSRELRNNVYVRNWLLPKKIEHVLLLSLSHNEMFMGVASLFRINGSNAFVESDKEIMNLLKKHLSLYLYKDSCCKESLTIPQSFLEQYNLTPRECEIISVLVSDKNTIEICSSMHISESTFRKHCSNIYQKLGINKKSELYKLLRY